MEIAWLRLFYDLKLKQHFVLSFDPCKFDLLRLIQSPKAKRNEIMKESVRNNISICVGDVRQHRIFTIGVKSKSYE